MTDYAKERCFLVGCARSGTTLLQSFMAAHSAIASFPETHFFANLTPNNTLASFLGLPNPKMATHLGRFSSVLESQGFNANLPAVLWPRFRLPHAFIECLDDLATQMGGSIWLEKTPRHVFHIRLIERSVPDAKFIHIIRNARDTIASIYQTTRQAEGGWGTPGGWPLENCTNSWVRSVKRSLQFDGRHRHHLVYYSDLVKNPKQCLTDICSFLEIEYEPEMISERTQQMEKLRTAGEFWKAGVGDSRLYQNTENVKFCEIFDSKQQTYVDEQTSATMADVLSKLLEIQTSRSPE